VLYLILINYMNNYDNNFAVEADGFKIRDFNLWGCC